MSLPEPVGKSPAEGAYPVPLAQRVFSLPTLMAFGVAVAFVALLATRFDLDWSSAWANIRGMNPWLYLLAFVAYYLSFVFRGMRWQILARNAAVDESAASRVPSKLQCAQLIIIGWFVNSVAWLRMGDAYRAYAFSEESEGSFSWSLGTVLAERVLDMAIILTLLVLSAALLATSRTSDASLYVVIGAFAMAFALTAALLMMRAYGTVLAQLLPNRLEEAYHRFHRGTLGSFKKLPILLALGLVGWLLEMARLYLVVQALDLQIALALVPVVALGNAILSTVPTPGGLGAVESGMPALLVLDLNLAEAGSVTVVDRSITYASVVVFGGLAFLLRQVLRARRRASAG